MDRETFMRDYWAYYLMLEDKFIDTTNYVTLAEDNYGTYSNEYAALMQMIGGELDSFFKVYCLTKRKKDEFEEKLENDNKKNLEKKIEKVSNKHLDIRFYKEYILETYPEIIEQEVKVRSANIGFCPFRIWKENDSKRDETAEVKQNFATVKRKTWWRAFTDVKHNRSSSKKDANQRNTLYLLGALYLLEMKYLKNITEESGERDIPDDGSKLFELHDWKTKYEKLGESLYGKIVDNYNVH